MNTISEDGQPCVPWDDWEYVAWQYIQKLEQEVLKLRDQLAEVQKGYAESIEARAGGNKCPYP